MCVDRVQIIERIYPIIIYWGWASYCSAKGAQRRGIRVFGFYFLSLGSPEEVIMTN
jgi:hypothetical protein